MRPQRFSAYFAFTLLAAGCTILGSIILYFGNHHNVPPFFWGAAIYIYLVTLGVIYFVRSRFKENPRRFIPTYIGATAIKMLLVVCGLLLVAYLDKPHLVVVGVPYAFLYLIFTGFEAVSLSAFVGKK